MNAIKVLYIEDSPLDVQLLETAFRKNNTKVDLFVIDDGDKAIKFIPHLSPNAECWPDVILVDFKLPRNNGLEVISTIYSNPSLSSLPIFIFTSAPKDRDIEACCLLGAEYRQKPCSLPEYLKFARYIGDLVINEKVASGESVSVF